MKARLYERYIKEVVPVLKDRHKYTNPHQVPRMEKIVVNMGVSASLEKSALDDAAKDLALITGRKPAISNQVPTAKASVHQCNCGICSSTRHKSAR